MYVQYICKDRYIKHACTTCIYIYHTHIYRHIRNGAKPLPKFDDAYMTYIFKCIYIIYIYIDINTKKGKTIAKI